MDDRGSRAPRRKGSGRKKRVPAPPAGSPPNGPPIVGIGASAGGLGALRRFFEHMPADSGLAFVVILHLDPTKESRAHTVLAPSTHMPVVQAEEGMQLEANRVHVIVPDRSLTVSHGVVHLTRMPAPRGDRHPIDTFFETLAEDQGEKAIAIVLSGTGTNGAAGLRAVQERGGMTIAQDPTTAEFTGMPEAAITIGAVDHVLPPEDMPEAVLHYARHPYVAAAGREAPGPDGGWDGLPELLALLRSRSGHDFTGYRNTMLVRRIHRRMSLAQITRLDEYTAMLRDTPLALSALTRDLLINVTRFFRDPEAWALLGSEVIDPLVRDAGARGTIRAWVPGCSTGPEAYSLAMLLLEATDDARTVAVSVFATDPVPEALEVARLGVYPASIAEEIPPARLARFFTHHDDSYHVKKTLREAVVFAPQNLLQDPPFSKLDLVSCRNVFIYLEPDTQSKLMRLFHFALREGGYLFLGPSETTGTESPLFDMISRKWRLFRKRNVPVRVPVTLPRAIRAEPPHMPLGLSRLVERAQHVLLDRYAPAAVLIDGQNHVLYYHGQADRYLLQPPGEPTHDLFVLVREGLRTRLRGLIDEARRNRKPARADDAQVRRGEELHPVVVEAVPFPLSSADTQHLLIAFREAPPPADTPAAAGNGGEVAHFGLEDELRAARDELQSTITQLETSNEELRAANEEVSSINEELQSSNEELETSKEEMQSLNEELITVNTQLQSKVEEVEKTASDLENLLANTEVATLFLDREFRIRLFTPTVTQLLDILPADVGRPISHFAPKYAGASDLLADAKTALEQLKSVTVEVTTPDGHSYLRRALPYRTVMREVDGVVITFIDITERAQAERGLATSKDLAERIINTVSDSLLVLDNRLHVQTANRAFYTTFGVEPEGARGHALWELAPKEWKLGELRPRLERVLQDGAPVRDIELTVELGTKGRRSMMLDARALTPDRSVLVVLRDITEFRRNADSLSAANAELEARVAQRTALLQLLEEITSAANEATTIEAPLQFTIKRVVEQFGWQAGHVYWRDEASGRFVPSTIWYTRVGLDLAGFRKSTMKSTFEPGQGLIGAVAMTKQPLWIHDLGADERFRPADARGGRGWIPKAGVFAPIETRGKVECVLEFYCDGPGELDPIVLGLLSQLGLQLGRVIERKQLETALATLAENEQRHIGQELHDQIGQSISAIAMLARGLQRKLDSRASVSPEDVARLLEAAEETKLRVRLLARSLIPEELEGAGLATALEDLAARSAATYGVECRLEPQGPSTIRNQATATQLFRIAQEALVNAAQHSKGTALTLRLRDESREHVLEIEDNGRGLSQEAQAGDGMGLRIMRHRAALIGGRLTITSEDGAGTVIRVVVPKEV